MKNDKSKPNPTGLGVRIGRSSLDSQFGDPVGKLQILAVQISSTQTTTKVTTQLRNINEKKKKKKNGFGKTTKIYFTVILILHKAGIEKE